MKQNVNNDVREDSLIESLEELYQIIRVVRITITAETDSKQLKKIFSRSHYLKSHNSVFALKNGLRYKDFELGTLYHSFYSQLY